jgi:3-methyladenine DNA glycosylase AlkC
MHPAQRFKAPSTILTGTPLKSMFDKAFLGLLAESFAGVYRPFNTRRFLKAAHAGLEELELSPRAAHIARVLVIELPDDPVELTDVIVASFGPELVKTNANGLAPFFYLPHSNVISTAGLKNFESGMRANYELTKRFSAEFSVRPFVVEYQAPALRLLKKWSKDSSPHVRRLVSEGTRPRLPWAMRLKAIQADPSLTLPLLEALKDDAEPYVQRSVANHLGDILKDHPEAAYETCERWIKEARRRSMPAAQSKGRLWVVRHAVRLPAKKGEKRAAGIRLLAKEK